MGIRRCQRECGWESAEGKGKIGGACEAFKVTLVCVCVCVFLFVVLLHHYVCKILAPQSGLEPTPSRENTEREPLGLQGMPAYLGV